MEEFLGAAGPVDSAAFSASRGRTAAVEVFAEAESIR